MLRPDSIKDLITPRNTRRLIPLARQADLETLAQDVFVFHD